MEDALKNIKILDLTRLLPGPFGISVLADLGAEIYKVESSREPDWARSLAGFYNCLNRGKKSVSLNLKTGSGREIFFKLLEKVDVLAEQFRPGVMEKLGAGYEECLKHNPRLVYVSLSGYGSDGPYADRAGHDLNYISLAGIAGITGTDAGEPAIPGVQIADQVGGLYLAIAILAGLTSVRQNGQGIKMEVSMFDSALSMVGPHLSEFFRSGKEPGPGEMQLNGALGNYHFYQTRDGRWLSLAPLEGKFWSNFCKATGRADWELRLLGGPEENRKVKQELTDFFRAEPLKYWEEFLARNPDLCLEPVRKFSEIENDPQVKARGIIMETKDRQGRPSKIVRSPIRSKDLKGEPAASAPPMGEDTESVLLGLGYTREEIEMFRKQGAI